MKLKQWFTLAFLWFGIGDCLVAIRIVSENSPGGIPVIPEPLEHAVTYMFLACLPALAGFMALIKPNKEDGK